MAQTYSRLSSDLSFRPVFPGPDRDSSLKHQHRSQERHSCPSPLPHPPASFPSLSYDPPNSMTIGRQPCGGAVVRGVGGRYELKGAEGVSREGGTVVEQSREAEFSVGGWGGYLVQAEQGRGWARAIPLSLAGGCPPTHLLRHIMWVHIGHGDTGGGNGDSRAAVGWFFEILGVGLDRGIKRSFSCCKLQSG
eukprot:768140-Hanusia_phi.AAC.2